VPFAGVGALSRAARWPFTPAQVAEFQALPYAADAVRIPRWDEAAKLPGRATPTLEQYRATLLAALRT